MNGPFALVAECGGPPGGGHVSIWVFEVAVRTIDRTQAVGAARGHHPRERGVPLVARVIGVQAADVHRPGAEARGEIRDAEMHRLESAARLRDRFDVSHAERGLDQDFDPDAVGDVPRRLDLREQRVHQVHVRRDPDLRHQDDVEPVARLLDDVDHVPVHVVRVDPVNAHGDRLAPAFPVMLEQAGHDVLPRLLLVGGRDGVFEVEEDVVGFTSERFLEHGGLRAGHGELAPLQAGRMRRLVPSETHALTVTRGVVFPPAVCTASGDWAAAPRASSGAAVPR